MPSPCWVAQMPSGLNAGLPCSASTRSMASLAYPPPLKKGANHHTAVPRGAWVQVVVPKTGGPHVTILLWSGLQRWQRIYANVV